VPVSRKCSVAAISSACGPLPPPRDTAAASDVTKATCFEAQKAGASAKSTTSSRHSLAAASAAAESAAGVALDMA
jgi:hypothetical protein